MNRNNNQRYQDTDQALMQAAIQLIGEQGAKGITVGGICRRAGVNRSTFYIHFQDLPALMDALEEELSRELVAAFTRDGTRDLVEGFENIFTFIYERADFYRAWFAQARRSRPFPFVLPPENIESLLSFRREIGLIQDCEFEYQRLFFMGGASEVTRAWLNGGCEQSPREITRILLGSFSYPKGPWFGQ